MVNVDLVELWLWFMEVVGCCHTLSIPLDDCLNFSLKPHKWLRYLGYAISGSRGHQYRYLPHSIGDEVSSNLSVDYPTCGSDKYSVHSVNV
jgi:hypothetical protein